jgi:hypothetical protein
MLLPLSIDLHNGVELPLIELVNLSTGIEPFLEIG